MFSKPENIKYFIKQMEGVHLASCPTYSLPLDGEVAGQDDLGSGDLHFFPLEDQVQLVQLPGTQNWLKPIFQFEVLKRLK